MLTTVTTITRRKKGNSASKSRKNYKKYKKKLRGKAVTLLKKENVNTTSTRKTHTKFWNFKTESQTNPEQKRKTNKHISDKPKHTSLHSKEPSNYKKTAGCSQWPAQPSAERSHCPDHKSQRKLRLSCLHPPASRDCPSSSAHRTPAPRCESRCPAFGAPAASARAKAPGLPSSYSAYTTCNKLRKISNL